MLRELKIRNLAIIDDLTIRFGEGLNVLTGETGAGKSIIVDALGLALGDRAQADLIRSGEKEATVQAFFEIGDRTVIPDVGLDISDGLILRRTISSGGKSRAYVNDTMVTLQTLAAVGRSLVDVHSQHEHQSLLLPEDQLLLVDSYGKLQQPREKVRGLFQETQALKSEFEGLSEKARERTHRIDFLQFQVQEIDASSLVAGEKERLLEERRILANLTKLGELVQSAYSLLYEAEGSCTERLSRAAADLREISAIDPGMEETLKTLESAAPLIEDACIALRGYRDRLENDPGRLDSVEDRLEQIRTLERKYGDGIEAILNFRDEAERELRLLESSDERLSALKSSLSAKEEELLAAALSLSQKRELVAKEIERLISGVLGDLAFTHAQLRIAIKKEAGGDGKPRIGSAGIDRAEFLFSANPGETPKPLSRIASGGELSRVMLALKCILAGVDRVPVLIFDEVDAGIGGKTAEQVGRKLEMIAANHQLLCITHLPQVAACGDNHLMIEKKEHAGRVRVDVRQLSGRQRKDEIARMLSGKITDISLRHAGELLERVR